MLQGGGAILSGGPVYPYVVVACQGCGYTLFFNAVVMGLAEASEKTEGQDASPA
jgi:hypothetical protein